MHAGRYADAIAELQRMIALYPNVAMAHAYLGGVYAETGRLDLLRAEQRRVAELTGDSGTWARVRIEDAWAAGRKADARAMLAALRRQVESGQGGYFGLAQLYVLTDDRPGALAMLERAFQRHEWILVTLKADPYFASLRTDPRYLDLIRRIGIP
jgi:tetratricopeptide (TPR) repeat protein